MIVAEVESDTVPPLKIRTDSVVRGMGRAPAKKNSFFKDMPFFRTTQVPETATITSSTTLMTAGTGLSVPGYLSATLDVDFTCQDTLGEGGAAVLFQGTLITDPVLKRNNGERQCVIKIIKQVSGQTEISLKNAFQLEVAIMALFQSNRHIARLLAFCPEHRIIVMRFYRLGSLQQLIHQPDHPLPNPHKYSPALVVKLLYELANGLAQMHYTGVVHNDIKPANILLDVDDQNDMFTVLCDFGLSNAIEESLYRVKAMPRIAMKGASVAYAAPEVFQRVFDAETSPTAEDTIFSIPQIVYEAVDTYAFGVVIFEMMTRTKPWGDEAKLEVVSKQVMAGERPMMTEEQQDAMAKIPAYQLLIPVMESCWHQQPQKRPHFKKLLTQLYKIMSKHYR